MVLKRGAPKGNTNRLKHGRYTARSMARRKLVRNTIRAAKLALFAAQVELASRKNRLMDKSR